VPFFVLSGRQAMMTFFFEKTQGSYVGLIHFFSLLLFFIFFSKNLVRIA